LLGKRRHRFNEDTLPAAEARQIVGVALSEAVVRTSFHKPSVSARKTMRNFPIKAAQSGARKQRDAEAFADWTHQVLEPFASGGFRLEGLQTVVCGHFGRHCVA
jgi:hypothetical protein